MNIFLAIDKPKTKMISLKGSSIMKGTDSVGSANFNGLCFHPGLEVSAKFKCPNYEKYVGKSCPYAHLKVYGVTMA